MYYKVSLVLLAVIRIHTVVVGKFLLTRKLLWNRDTKQRCKVYDIL